MSSGAREKTSDACEISRDEGGGVCGKSREEYRRRTHHVREGGIELRADEDSSESDVDDIHKSIHVV